MEELTDKQKQLLIKALEIYLPCAAPVLEQEDYNELQKLYDELKKESENDSH